MGWFEVYLKRCTALRSCASTRRLHMDNYLNLKVDISCRQNIFSFHAQDLITILIVKIYFEFRKMFNETFNKQSASRTCSTFVFKNFTHRSSYCSANFNNEARSFL
jgi:hypothetical protein